MRIALLPDTRPEVGFGHLRRCQALAYALQRLGCECVWSKDGNTMPDAVVIDDYRQHEHDELFSPLLQHRGCCIVRFDDGIVPVRRRCIRDDDGQLLDIPADIVINGAPGAESLRYKLRNGSVELLGPQYLCLAPLIADLAARGGDVWPEVRRVVVSLGGNPPRDIFYRVVNAVKAVLPQGVELQPILDEPLVPILECADIAITGGGQTMLESVALGVPTIAIVMGANQRAQVENLFAEGAVEGGISWDSTNLMPSLQSCVQMVVAQTGLRQYMAEVGRRLIDGRGAERVAKVIVGRLGG